jgi:hypothetical protein
MDCAGLEDVAPELALGIADGAERAAAIAHLAHCAHCRELIDDLGRLSDDLLLLAPEAEPPLGFESRVRDRISASAAAAGRSPRTRLRLLGAAAALVLVAAGGLVAGWLTARSPGAAARDVAIVRNGEGVCRVVSLRGHPSELVVRLDEPGEESADYTVDAVGANGSPAVLLGALHLRDGRGALDAAVPANAGRVSAVVVMDIGGGVRYRVTFPAV